VLQNRASLLSQVNLNTNFETEEWDRGEVRNLKNNASRLSGSNQAELQHELYLVRDKVFLPFLRPTLPVSFLCFTLAILTISIYKHYNGNTLEREKKNKTFFRMPCQLFLNCQLHCGTWSTSTITADSRHRNSQLEHSDTGYKTLTGRQVWASAVAKTTFTTYYYHIFQNIVHKFLC